MRVQLDIQPYVRAPRINAYSGLALTIRMLKAAPSDPDEAELEALIDMRDCGEALQAAIRALADAESLDLRPYDRRLDGGWASLHGHLAATARREGTPEAERAAELLTWLFPEGLAFLKTKFEHEWIHSRLLLERIAEQELEPELAKLANPSCLPYIQDAHAEFGRALGLAELAVEEVEVVEEQGETDESLLSVGEALRELSEAIAAYTRTLAGRIRRKQPETYARFMAAVAPLDAHRAAHRARASSSVAGEPEQASEEPEDFDVQTPLPPVPGGPADA